MRRAVNSISYFSSYHKAGLATISHSMTINNNIYIHTERCSLLTRASLSAPGSRNFFSVGEKARARKIMELNMITMVMSTQEVVHSHGPLMTSTAPERTSACPACFTSRTATWKTFIYVSCTWPSAVCSFFTKASSTKNGPIEATALTTCIYITS